MMRYRHSWYMQAVICLYLGYCVNASLARALLGVRGHVGLEQQNFFLLCHWDGGGLKADGVWKHLVPRASHLGRYPNP